MRTRIAVLAIWLHKRTHISQFVGTLSLGLLVGTLAVQIVGNPSLHPLWLSTSAILFAVSVKRARRGWLTVALVSGMIIGLVRAGSYSNSLAYYDGLIGKQLTVSGIIADDPTFTASGKQRLLLKSIKIDGEEVEGAIAANLNSTAEFKRSDKLLLNGILGTGFGSNSASLSSVSILEAMRPVHGDMAREFRDWFASSLRKDISEPSASLGLGFLVGQRGSLPQYLEDQLRVVGLTHIVVASGYNLTILIRFARKKLMRVSRYTALICSLGLVTGFILVTGFSPSMTRAGIVAVLSLFAWYYGRRINPLILLATTAAITVLIKPSYIWGDIGWYLSFLAFFGVLVVAPLIRNYFFADKLKPNFIRDILIETTSAQLMTIPLIAFVFGEYSPLSLVANLLVLPVIPFAMLATFISGVVSGVFPVIGSITSLPAEFLLGYITNVVAWLAESPYASGNVSVLPVYLALVYGLVLIATFWMHWRTRNMKLAPLI